MCPKKTRKSVSLKGIRKITLLPFNSKRKEKDIDRNWL